MYTFNDPQEYYYTQSGQDNDPDPIWRDATLTPDELLDLCYSGNADPEDLPF